MRIETVIGVLCEDRSVGRVELVGEVVGVEVRAQGLAEAPVLSGADVDGVQPVEAFSIFAHVAPGVAEAPDPCQHSLQGLGDLDLGGVLALLAVGHDDHAPAGLALLLLEEPVHVREDVAKERQISEEKGEDHRLGVHDLGSSVDLPVSDRTAVDAEFPSFLLAPLVHLHLVAGLLVDSRNELFSDTSDLDEDRARLDAATFELHLLGGLHLYMPPLWLPQASVRPEFRAFNHITAPYFCQCHF